jgi:hypothetical protein
MLDIAIVLVHSLHLLCMNVAAAGPLVCVGLDWMERHGNSAAGEAGRWLAATALIALLLGAALGTALGALLWDASYAAVLQRLPSKIHAGIWELLFSLVLLAVYLAWWYRRREAKKIERLLRSALAVLLATNLLYHFPVLFAIISKLNLQPAVGGGVIDSADFRRRLLDSYVASRSVHFVLASLAVSGVALIAYAVRRSAGEKEATAWARLAQTGGWIGLLPSLAQIPIGLWVVTGLPSEAKRRLMGQDPLGSVLLLVSVLAALWLMHLLAAVALGNASPRKCRLAVGATVLVVLLMTALAHYARPPETDSAGMPTAPPSHHSPTHRLAAGCPASDETPRS